LIQAQQTADYKKTQEFRYTDLSSFSIATDEEANIFLPLEDGKVKSIKLSGEVNWQTDLGGYIVSDLVYDNNQLYLLIEIVDKKYLTSLSSETGLVRWKELINASDNVKLYKQNKSILLINNESTYLINTQEEKLDIIELNKSIKLDNISSITIEDRKISLFNEIGKKNIWQKIIGGNIITAQIYKDGILISATDNFLYFLKVKNGKLIWKFRFENNVNAQPIIDEDKIIVLTTSNEKKVYFIETIKGKLIDEKQICDECYITKPIIKLKNTLVIQTPESIVLLTK
jgi:outer membrane protein assembly factor BamB